jgi:ribosomal protein S8E
MASTQEDRNRDMNGEPKKKKKKKKKKHGADHGLICLGTNVIKPNLGLIPTFKSVGKKRRRISNCTCG